MRYSESNSELRELKVSSLDYCHCDCLITFLFVLFVRVGTRFDSSRYVLSIVELVEYLEFLGDT